jgi:O-antigen/teichoic acid export membrane protein
MSLRSNFFNGVKHVAIAKYSNVIINLIIGAILARLLSPSEYGIVAIVSVFILFFGMLSTLGLSAGVVQFDQLSNKDLSSLFNISAVIGIILSLVFIFVSYGIADLYGDRVYVLIGQMMSPSIFFKAVSSVPLGILQRERKFKLIGIFTVSISVLTGIIGVVLAFEGFSYWTLVYRTVLTSTFTFLLAFVLSGTELRFTLHTRGLGAVTKYSGYTFLFNFFNYFSRNLDNILIGKYLGPIQVGIYDKAYVLMRLPLDNLLNLFSPVLHPILANQKEDISKIYFIHQRFLKVLAVLGIFISLFFFHCSNEIVTILYGEQWTQSAEPFKWLAISIWIQILLSSTGSFYLVSGKGKFYFYTGLISSVSTVAAITLGVFEESIQSVAIYLSIAFCFNLCVFYFILYKFIFKVSFFRFFGTIQKPVLIGIACFLVLIPFNTLDFPLILSLGLKCLVLSVTFVCGLFLTKEVDFVKAEFFQMLGIVSK